MTREEHLEFCKRCLNRKFDPNIGLLCGLTGKVANFDKVCEVFKMDNTVELRSDNLTALAPKEIQEKLPTEIFNQLKQQQDFPKAIVVGILSALLCSMLWAAFTVYTSIQFSGMAILLGAGVGYSMRQIGKGIDTIFGVAGAIISLMGCLLGNFLSIIGFIAQENNMGYFDTLVNFDYSFLDEAMIATFDFRDIIFYTLAISTGFALSKKTITDKDIKSLKWNGK